jgi:predicted O-methyltransferase YrrM
MDQQLWTQIDGFLADALVAPDEALEAALAASEAAGLPAIHVTPNQGKLLHLLARVQGARRILEIGTLGGYSTIWLARALPAGGQLITLEADPRHAAVARGNLARAGVANRVELRLGPAADALQHLATDLAAGRIPPFDFTFIDADKESTADYFSASIRLSRPGSLIVVDNVVRAGKVLDAATADASAQGIRRFLDSARADHRVTATAIQTVGGKGHDGFAVALVLDGS